VSRYPRGSGIQSRHQSACADLEKRHRLPAIQAPEQTIDGCSTRIRVQRGVEMLKSGMSVKSLRFWGTSVIAYAAIERSNSRVFGHPTERYGLPLECLVGLGGTSSSEEKKASWGASSGDLRGLRHHSKASPHVLCESWSKRGSGRDC